MNLKLKYMNTLIQDLDQHTKNELPEAYKLLLNSFNAIQVLELKIGEEVDFLSIKKLLEPYNKSSKRHQMIEVLMEDYTSLNKTQTLFCREKQTQIEDSLFTESFYFASMSDDSRLFFNLKDWSVWEFWMDDKSVSKIADDFDEFIVDSKIIEKDDWNIFTN